MNKRFAELLTAELTKLIEERCEGNIVDEGSNCWQWREWRDELHVHEFVAYGQSHVCHCACGQSTYVQNVHRFKDNLPEFTIQTTRMWLTRLNLYDGYIEQMTKIFLIVLTQILELNKQSADIIQWAVQVVHHSRADILQSDSFNLQAICAYMEGR